MSHREQSRFWWFWRGKRAKARRVALPVSRVRGDVDVHERRDERELRACHAITNTAGIVAAREGERWSKAGGVGEEERELVVVENPPVTMVDGRVMPNVSVAVEIHSNK